MKQEEIERELKNLAERVMNLEQIIGAKISHEISIDSRAGDNLIVSNGCSVDGAIAYAQLGGGE
jgi:hypothetical protein